MADEGLFSVRVKGVSLVKKALNAYAVNTGLLFSRERIETLLETRWKGRLDSAGETAQKDAKDQHFRLLAPATLRSGGSNASILRRSATLRDDIQVVRRRMSGIDVQSPAGGGFRIGVRGESEKYAALHQRGGYAGWGGQVYIPQRRFLGVSPSDVRAVDKLIAEVMKV